MYFKSNSNSNIPLIHLYVGQTSGNLYLPEHRDSKIRKKASEEGSSFKAHALYSLDRDPSFPGNDV